MRAIFEAAFMHSDLIVRPCCSECGTATLLIGVESRGFNQELRTFECPSCQHFETAVGKPAKH